MAEPLRRRVRTSMLSGLATASSVLPNGALRGVLEGAGVLARRGKYGELTRKNLEHALGNETTEAEREAILRGVFRHGARLFSEWLRLARPAAERDGWIESKVRIDPSIEILERELARGRGAIVVTAHIGNWELLAAALRRWGLDGTVVGRRRERDSSSDWLIAMRRAYGVPTLPQDSPPRRLLEVLGRGAILGLLTDLEVRRLDGEFLPFLGRPALTMTAPGALARAHQAPLVPVRCILPQRVAPGAEGQYLLSVEKPLALDRGLPRREATLDLCLRMNQVFERWIRETPEQWAWHQDRWRTGPGQYDVVPLEERKRRKAAER